MSAIQVPAGPFCAGTNAAARSGRPFLRMIGSSACRGADRVPLSIIAKLTSLSR
jgi:hypothetical protein